MRPIENDDRHEAIVDFLTADDTLVLALTRFEAHKFAEMLLSDAGLTALGFERDFGWGTRGVSGRPRTFSSTGSSWDQAVVEAYRAENPDAVVITRWSHRECQPPTETDYNGVLRKREQIKQARAARNIEIQNAVAKATQEINAKYAAEFGDLD